MSIFKKYFDNFGKDVFAGTMYGNPFSLLF